jgi:hypothetical protein
MAPPPYRALNPGEGAYSSEISAVVFMLFVVAGSAYIILAKLGGIGQIYVTFVPVAIMIGYAWLIWFARSLRLRDDQAGDNLYYMGFLFTLTSLGVSLYQFNAARAAEDIVQNFGIAIGSTISGIALRVIFNQMRQDPVEVERHMRLELAEAARRVRREMDSTVVEFGYARRSAHQAAEDSFRLVAEKFDEIAAKLLASTADVARKSAQPLEAASRRSADMVERLTSSMAAAVSESTRRLAAEIERLSTSAGGISVALDEVTTKLGAMRTPNEVVEMRLEPVISSLTAVIDRFSTHAEGQVGTMREFIASAKIAAETSSATILALREELAASTTTNAATLKETTGIMTAMARILDEFESEAKAQVEVLRLLQERTDETIRGLTDILLQAGVDLALQASGLRDVLHATRATAQTLATATDRIADIAEDIGSRHDASNLERDAPNLESDAPNLESIE